MENKSVIPISIQLAANAAKNDTLPEKSRGRYSFAYGCYKDWAEANGVAGNHSEDVILAYVKFLADDCKQCPATLWSTFSMLKQMIQVKENVEIGKYHCVLSFLKTRSKGYVSKKAMVFSEEEVKEFLFNASDNVYLAMKVIAIMGILGACRSQEITDLTVEDLEDLGGIFHVKVKKTKTCVCRSFTISGHYYEIVKKYMKLRPADLTTSRLLLNYNQGKCSRQVIGKNTVAKVPEKIAEYLHLPNTKRYTGHSFRRTSATLLANAGGDLLAIKRQGGWRSSACAERYLEESVHTKRKAESLITSGMEPSSSAVSSEKNEEQENLRKSGGEEKDKFSCNFDVNIEFSQQSVAGTSQSRKEDTILKENRSQISSMGVDFVGFSGVENTNGLLEEGMAGCSRDANSFIVEEDDESDWYVTPVVSNNEIEILDVEEKKSKDEDWFITVDEWLNYSDLSTDEDDGSDVKMNDYEDEKENMVKCDGFTAPTDEKPAGLGKRSNGAAMYLSNCSNLTIRFG